MKKNILLLLLILTLLTGCSPKKEEKIVEKKKVEPKPEVVEEVDEDLNPMPIGFYDLEGNHLVRLHEIHEDLVVEKDVGLFQVYPSFDEEIYLDEAFGPSFYQKWTEYNQSHTIKIGFHIHFTLFNGEEVSYNILYPSQTFDKWEYLMNYLYDDYAHFGDYFYSHIENDEFTENTLFTAFKMQSSYQCNEIHSSIQLSVFTYDTDDDFDENGLYRGNSIHTFKICVNGYEC